MKSKLKFTYIIFRNVLILFFVLEIGLGIFYIYYDNHNIELYAEKIIASNVYDNLDDESIKEMFREVRSQDMQWESYLHYRLKPMNGKHNTIDVNGIRKTVNPSIKDSTTALKIFCFGGSTMYSSGARDAHTIPSELSQLIYTSFPNQNIAITNFGCHGYTRATENIQLQKELIKNNIPDIVIFYDGVNEIISAYHGKEAGIPANSSNRRHEFKVAHSYKKRIKMMITSSNLNRFKNKIVQQVSSHSAYVPDKRLKESLAKDIAETYIGYVKLSKSLEHAHGFKVFNFMQPHIYSKKNLTKVEKEYFKEQQYFKNLYDLSYETIRKNSLMSKDITFVDISNIFDTEEKTIYIDFCHTGELGNLLVAKKIFSYLKPELDPKRDLQN
ncbi:SGNH/GDSL hydrolase family protein [Lacinutrix jangbogonensis]|uniref:SGNH/GDSL hydrolase family protein n=1 Tax=Lacinutrix jangbogonensis TaxID=1469557 RepID=UPI00053DE72E|nr:SGNH/GDSL hydrolase family protein [Lacinutrix jangbogonensis]